MAKKPDIQLLKAKLISAMTFSSDDDVKYAVEQLFKEGVNPNVVQHPNGYSMKEFAEAQGRPSVVELLRSYDKGKSAKHTHRR